MRDNTSHIVIIFLLTLITFNLFILDLKVFTPSSAIQLSDITSVSTVNPTPTNNPNAILPQNLLCPNSCLTAIQQATESSRVGSNSQSTIANPQSTTITRESYIPLGSGSTSKSDWEDLTATETILNPANYGRIKEAYFIASLTNPTQNGQIEAQLYNVTDKHLVWGSLVIMNGPPSQTITSDKIVLDTGTKLYRVQLKSSLQFPSSLNNAKIRIISE